jgi:hypothetical protein
MKNLIQPRDNGKTSDMIAFFDKRIYYHQELNILPSFSTDVS